MPENDRSELISNSERSLAEALRSQPLLAPEHSAWPAIQASLHKRIPRKNIFWGSIVSAFALFAVTVISLKLLYPPAPDIKHQPLAELIRHSQQLETELKNLEAEIPLYDATTAVAITELEDMIALVDLQLAGPVAEQGQTQTLWQQRVNLMQTISDLQTQQIRTVSYNP